MTTNRSKTERGNHGNHRTSATRLHRTINAKMRALWRSPRAVQLSGHMARTAGHRRDDTGASLEMLMRLSDLSPGGRRVGGMSVYVDEMIDWSFRPASWRNDCSCHMFADTEIELDQMAAAIGLHSSCKNSRTFPLPSYYDLTIDRRLQAVQRGAVQCTYTELERREAVAYSWSSKAEIT